MVASFIRNERATHQRRCFFDWIGVRGTPYVVILLLGWLGPVFAGDSYDLAFSTYFGGRDWEHARDVAVDSQGNIYVVGGAASADFPTTPGVYSQTLHAENISGGDPILFAAGLDNGVHFSLLLNCR